MEPWVKQWMVLWVKPWEVPWEELWERPWQEDQKDQAWDQVWTVALWEIQVEPWEVLWEILAEPWEVPWEVPWVEWVKPLEEHSVDLMVAQVDEVMGAEVVAEGGKQAPNNVVLRLTPQQGTDARVIARTLLLNGVIQKQLVLVVEDVEGRTAVAFP